MNWVFFNHQAPQVENESGVEGEEEIGDSHENLCTISLLLSHSGNYIIILFM